MVFGVLPRPEHAHGRGNGGTLRNRKQAYSAYYYATLLQTPAFPKQTPLTASLPQLLKLPAAILFPEGAALLVKIPGPAEILRHPVAELIKHTEILAGFPALKLAPFLKIFLRPGIVLAAQHSLGQVKARIAAAPGIIKIAGPEIQLSCFPEILLDAIPGEDDIAAPETALAVFEGTALLIVGNSLRRIFSRAGAFLIDLSEIAAAPEVSQTAGFLKIFPGCLNVCGSANAVFAESSHVPAALLFIHIAGFLKILKSLAEVFADAAPVLVVIPDIDAPYRKIKVTGLLIVRDGLRHVLGSSETVLRNYPHAVTARAVIERTPFLKSGSGLRKIPGYSGAPEISFAKLKAVVPFSGGASFGIVIRLPAAFAENESASPVKRATPALDKLRGVLLISLSSD